MLLNTLLLVAEIVCIVTGISLLTEMGDCKLFYAIEIIKLCALFIHSFWLIYSLGYIVYRFIVTHNSQK